MAEPPKKIPQPPALHEIVEGYTIPFDEKWDFDRTRLKWSPATVTCRVLPGAGEPTFLRITEIIKIALDGQGIEVLSIEPGQGRIEGFYFVTFDVNVKDEEKAKGYLKQQKHAFDATVEVKVDPTGISNLAGMLPPGVEGAVAGAINRPTVRGRTRLLLELPPPFIWIPVLKSLAANELEIDTAEAEGSPYEIHLLQYVPETGQYEERDEELQFITTKQVENLNINTFEVKQITNSRFVLKTKRVIIGDRTSISPTEKILETRNVGEIEIARKKKDTQPAHNQPLKVAVSYKHCRTATLSMTLVSERDGKDEVLEIDGEKVKEVEVNGESVEILFPNLPTKGNAKLRWKVTKPGRVLEAEGGFQKEEMETRLVPTKSNGKDCLGAIIEICKNPLTVADQIELPVFAPKFEFKMSKYSIKGDEKDYSTAKIKLLSTRPDGTLDNIKELKASFKVVGGKTFEADKTEDSAQLPSPDTKETRVKADWTKEDSKITIEVEAEITLEGRDSSKPLKVRSSTELKVIGAKPKLEVKIDPDVTSGLSLDGKTTVTFTPSLKLFEEDYRLIDLKDIKFDSESFERVDPNQTHALKLQCKKILGESDDCCDKKIKDEYKTKVSFKVYLQDKDYAKHCPDGFATDQDEILLKPFRAYTLTIFIDEGGWWHFQYGHVTVRISDGTPKGTLTKGYFPKDTTTMGVTHMTLAGEVRDDTGHGFTVCKRFSITEADYKSALATIDEWTKKPGFYQMRQHCGHFVTAVCKATSLGDPRRPWTVSENVSDYSRPGKFGAWLRESGGKGCGGK